MSWLRIKRGTRAQLNAAATANALNQGEPYLITNEGRIAVGLSASSYETYCKSSEILQPVRPSLNLTIAATQIAPTTQIQSANALRAFPWHLKKLVTISGFRQEVSTLIAGTTFRLALYADNGSAYPGAIILNTDLGTYDSATAGMRTATPPSALALSPGWYWLAVNNSGAPTLRAVSAGAIDNILGSQGGGGTNSQVTGWTISQAYGPMPATFPSGATLLANIAAPWTMFTTA